MIYFLCAPEVKKVKIGWTENFPQRLSAIRRVSPCRIDVLATMPGTEEQEQPLLQEISWAQDHHEWFYDGPEIREWMDKTLGASPAEYRQW